MSKLKTCCFVILPAAILVASGLAVKQAVQSVKSAGLQSNGQGDAVHAGSTSLNTDEFDELRTEHPMDALTESKFHKPLQYALDQPGIQQPDVLEVDQAELDDSEIVFGVVVNESALAVARSALVEPSQHIVNFILDAQPVSISYCDLADCVRALTSETESTPIDLHIGGLDIDDQLVLLLNGIRYGQTSVDVPLDDVPVATMTFGAWKRQHPATRVIDAGSIRNKAATLTGRRNTVSRDDA